MSDPQPASAVEIEHAIINLNAIMDRLEETIANETAHARAGRLREVVAIEATKTDLARRYAVESERLRTASALIAPAWPQTLEALRQRHTAFQSLLQTNLTVLATAHAVAEGIIRGVSGELARKRAPSTYSASGRANAPSPTANQPLALSRTL